ncbi:EcsC family protein [Novosphingobium sp. FSY-8]|uniref:EcsC family protein n=1 Tax=Novosphingobium ovatum TaxID=1908523 RepID=A0ABW9XBJ7_9SPHN|nr:EcsC family protein [Novosphingobium ovatum]NBC35907.1 EcsC family protein [Novosphingobium ovatum]
MSEDVSILEKIKDYVLNVDPEGVVRDAKLMGMDITCPADFANNAHNYTYIERLSQKYADTCAKYCAASGLTSGVGGITTTITLAGADIANMAAQLYWLNQKLALLNGFEPENDLHNQRSQAIFMTALGIEQTAQAAIRATVAKVAAENLAKKGPASAPVIRLIMEIAKIIGVKITKIQAGKLIPIIGGVIGASLNYYFSTQMSKKMMNDYKSDYFDRWQIKNR